MSNVNLVILVGRLGADPEVKNLSSGNTVCKFSLATSKKWKDQNGQSKEKTQWHNIVAWNRTADFIGQYMRKGGLAYIEGELETRSYEDSQGVKKYVTEIICQKFNSLTPLNSNGQEDFHDEGFEPSF